MCNQDCKKTTGEIITDYSKQMERWAEHYQELYSRETVMTDTAVENSSPLPVIEELDDPPTIDHHALQKQRRSQRLQ